MRKTVFKRLVVLCGCLAILASCSEEVEMPATDNSTLSRSAISESADNTMESYAYFYDQKMPVSIDTSKKYVIRRKNNVSVASVPYAATVTEEYEGEIVDASELSSISTYSAQTAATGDVVAIEDVTDEGVPLHQFVFVGLKKKSDMGLLEKLASEIGCEVLGTIPGNDMIVKLSTGLGSEMTSLPASVYLYEHGDFKFVDPGFKITYESLADEPLFSSQWALCGRNGINVSRAWLTTKGSPDITIAIVDRGINTQLSEFNSHMHSYSFSYNTGIINDHGTQVASIAGASHNGLYMAGVAPLAKLMDINYTHEDVMKLSECIQNANLNGADIINCSWGSTTNLWDNVIIETIHNAVKNGRNGKGCIVVFAAGNDGVIAFPAKKTEGTIIVGATDANGNVTSISGKGEELTVVAPGENVLVMNYDGSTDSYNGTSLAAPHVAGLAALILSVRPELTAEQVKNIIIETSSRTTHNNDYGWGLINAGNAVDAAAQNYSISVNKNIITPTNGRLTYYLSGAPRSANVVWSSRSGARLVTSGYSSATFEYPTTTGNIPETITAKVTHYGKTKSVTYTGIVTLAAYINSITKVSELDMGNNYVHLFADCTKSTAPIVWEIYQSSGTQFELQEFMFAGDANYIGRESHYATLVCGPPYGTVTEGAYCKIGARVNEVGGGTLYCVVRGRNGQWVVEDEGLTPTSIEVEETE